MPTVELIYRPDCPNIAATRENLLKALAEAGLLARWREWNADDPETPKRLRCFGSPSLLVDGRDVAGDEDGTRGGTCRLYAAAGGPAAGIPDVARIAQALGRNAHPGAAAPRSALPALLPTAALALLPKLTCPLCFPAYAAALSALGVGFFDYTPYLPPAIGAFLLASVLLLAWTARRSGRVLPLAIGAAAATAVAAGKFAWEADTLVYAGAALMIVAPFARRGSRGRVSCRTCIEEKSA